MDSKSFARGGPRGGGGGGWGTLVFSHIRRLGLFRVQNSEFQYFLGVSEK